MNVLVLGVGNPSRGDDALGPLLIERLEGRVPPGVELLTDFQLQVEHLLDLHGRDLVVFADASVAAAAPFEFAPVGPAASGAALATTTHAMEPAALLSAYVRHYATAPPPACMLAMRTESFELGAPPGNAALQHLQAAAAFLEAYLARAQRDGYHRDDQQTGGAARAAGLETFLTHDLATRTPSHAQPADPLPSESPVRRSRCGSGRQLRIRCRLPAQ